MKKSSKTPKEKLAGESYKSHADREFILTKGTTSYIGKLAFLRPLPTSF